MLIETPQANQADTPLGSAAPRPQKLATAVALAASDCGTLHEVSPQEAARDDADAAVSIRFDAIGGSPLRQYGLLQLLHLLGVRVQVEAGAAPTVYYGGDSQHGRQASIWIPPDERLDEFQQAVKLSDVQGVLVPHLGACPDRLWHDNRLTFDLGWAAAFWLALGGERYSSQRDEHDRLPARASLLASDGRLTRPPIHDYLRLLQERLHAAHCEPGFTGGGPGEPSFKPRWPHGKAYAVALSHDVDGPERPSRLPSLLGELARGGRRPRRRTYWDIRSEIRARTLWGALWSRATSRREWDFDEFCSLEREHGLRSAFYFAVVTRHAGHLYDVAYDVTQPRYRRLFRELLSEGWEVGLHAAYGTFAKNPPVAEQYARLADLAGQPVSGGRHHYLRLDGHHPMRTLAAHADAGALYDSTAGFNDFPGFRPGVALPFQTHHPADGCAAGLVELPMTISDMHLSQQDAAAATDAVIHHLSSVRALGGLAVLNWHVGHWHSAPAWRESYRAACQFLAEDPHVWVAAPRDIAAWWQSRTEPPP